MTLFCRQKTAAAPIPVIGAENSYKSLDLADRPVFEKLITAYPQPVAGYTFAELYSWHVLYHYEWRLTEDGTLLLRCAPDGDGKTHFLQPLGPFGEDARESFMHDLKTQGPGTKVLGVSQAFLDAHPAFAAQFEAYNDPDLANYVYATDDLATLAGKAYAKKRNQIKQAAASYPWTVEALTPQTVADCLEVMTAISESNLQDKDEPAVLEAIRHFDAIGLEGTLLRSEGKPIGFALFEQLTPDTMVVVFEKAIDAYKGVYQVVNQETAKMIAEKGLPRINREEDMGLPGLRHAKLSYNPIEMIPAYTLTRK